ncbi:MAG: hypothetical protein Q4G67_04395, partial [Actinomycetia bacterium]|nr:hypothetical protein [Actinomycetes bacterium]
PRQEPTPRQEPQTPSVFEARNRLAGADLYTGADLTGSPPALPLDLAPDESIDLIAICPPGSLLTLDAPHLTGSVSVAGHQEDYPSGWDVKSPRELTDSTGAPTRLQVTASAASSLPAVPLACLDPDVLEQVVAEPAPETALRSSSFTVRWPEPDTSADTAVVSVPAYQGWRCEADGETVPVRALSGLISVPFTGATELTCHYRQPHLRHGLGLSALAALGLVGIALTGRRRG